jgi:hypothetical protein
MPAAACERSKRAGPADRSPLASLLATVAKCAPREHPRPACHPFLISRPPTSPTKRQHHAELVSQQGPAARCSERNHAAHRPGAGSGWCRFVSRLSAAAAPVGCSGMAHWRHRTTMAHEFGAHGPRRGRHPVGSPRASRAAPPHGRQSGGGRSLAHAGGFGKSNKKKVEYSGGIVKQGNKRITKEDLGLAPSTSDKGGRPLLVASVGQPAASVCTPRRPPSSPRAPPAAHNIAAGAGPPHLRVTCQGSRAAACAPAGAPAVAAPAKSKGDYTLVAKVSDFALGKNLPIILANGESPRATPAPTQPASALPRHLASMGEACSTPRKPQAPARDRHTGRPHD